MLDITLLLSIFSQLLQSDNAILLVLKSQCNHFNSLLNAFLVGDCSQKSWRYLMKWNYQIKHNY